MKIKNPIPYSGQFLKILRARSTFRENIQEDINYYKDRLSYLHHAQQKKERFFKELKKKPELKDKENYKRYQPKEPIIKTPEDQKYYQEHGETRGRHNSRGFYKRQKMNHLKEIQAFDEETKIGILNEQNKNEQKRAKERLENLEWEQRDKEREKEFRRRYAKNRTTKKETGSTAPTAREEKTEETTSVRKPRSDKPFKTDPSNKT